MATTMQKRRPVKGAHRAPGHGRRHAPEEGDASWAQRVLALATLTTVAAALGLLAWSALGMVVAPWKAQPAAGTQASAFSVPARDPRLIVQPRTVTQAAVVDGLRLALTVHPLVPGPNRVVIVLADHGRALADAHVYAAATMPGMPMRPVHLEAREAYDGQYVGLGVLPMFGDWQIAVHVERRHAAPLVHVFAVSLDLPPALLNAVAAARDQDGR
jgi:hypothetical protein